MKRFFFLIFCIIANLHLFPQSGKVINNILLHSNILNMERSYSVYLPPGYDNSSQYYPILYLLHGKGGDHTEWITDGELLRITDQCLNNGTATPMIIILPNANDGIVGYTNNAIGTWRYEDYFMEEFIPFVESIYRVKNERRFRAIGGLSMGGGGTFLYALHRPDLFIAACPLSAATRTMDNPDRIKFIDEHIKPNATEQQVADWIKKYNVHGLINNMPELDKGKVNWYIDCGDDDFLYEGNSLIHIEMRKNNIPHEFRIRNGTHDWTYWKESLPEVLRFVSAAYNQ